MNNDILVSSGSVPGTSEASLPPLRELWTSITGSAPNEIHK